MKRIIIGLKMIYFENTIWLENLQFSNKKRTSKSGNTLILLLLLFL